MPPIEEHPGAPDISSVVEAALRVIDGLLAQRPTDLVLLRDAMALLFSYLSSAEGRTESNVARVDSFFMRGIDDESYWAHLPEAFRGVLWDAGAQLHDSIGSPQVAANFDSTPEQLLARTLLLKTDVTAS